MASSSASSFTAHFVSMGFSEDLVIRAIQVNGEDEASVLEFLSAYSVPSSPKSSSSKMVRHFMSMGFPKELIIQTIQENGENEASVLDFLLTDSSNLLEPTESEDISNFCQDHFDETNSSSIGINSLTDSSSSKLLRLFVDMGYSEKLVIEAMEENGEDEDSILSYLLTYSEDLSYKKRKLQNIQNSNRQGNVDMLEEDGYNSINMPNPMVGFGIPDGPWQRTERKFHPLARGPPYFYYENVALTPKGVWRQISSFLNDIHPEFVDSRYFCAAARKRGYIHNLPIQNRFPVLPRQPLTIQEALPSMKKWWPWWDERTKLNCLLTTYGSAKLTQRIKKALEDCDGEPTPSAKKYVMEECRRWNLVWVGKNTAAPLEPDEMEMLLGYPKHHTRGGGGGRSDRYKALGNSFQVDTVAYHLSPLKNLFPNGINVLSLFTGIGGAEVALHRLGIPLNNVVSVELSKVNRSIFRSWWEQTNQKGSLIEIEDVQNVNAADIQVWMKKFGGFDLVIGGSPCNNLAGGNRHSRDGLEGEHSSLFFDYYRILELVRSAMYNR